MKLKHRLYIILCRMFTIMSVCLSAMFGIRHNLGMFIFVSYIGGLSWYWGDICQYEEGHLNE